MRQARVDGRVKDIPRSLKRKSIRKYFKENPEKYKAKILSQRIPKKPCEVCGDPDSQRHHDDYSKPLEVRFLCTKHHAEHHVMMRERELIASPN